MPLEGEEPIAQRKVVDVRLGKGDGKEKVVHLYQSELDELVARLREHPEIIEMMAEDFGFFEKDPESWRQNMLSQGISYDARLMAVADDIGLEHYSVFGRQIRDFVWKCVRPDNV